MVVGENGVNGTHVKYLVGELTKREPVYVIARSRNTVGRIVRWMDRRIRDLKDVTKIHVQVSQMTL